MSGNAARMLCALSTLTLAGLAQATVTGLASAKGDFVVRGYRVGNNTQDTAPFGLEIAFKGSDPGSAKGKDDANNIGSGFSDGSSGAYWLANGGSKGGGFTVSSYTESTASPAGSAKAELGAWGEFTFENKSASDITVLYEFNYRWVSSTLGNLPLREKGKSDPKIVTLNNETFGQVTQYPTGQTIAIEGSPDRELLVRKGESFKYRITCTAKTEVSATIPSPGPIALAGTGLALIAGRRRSRHTSP